MNEHISVMTDFGELIATPFAGGISVDINLPDGTGRKAHPAPFIADYLRHTAATGYLPSSYCALLSSPAGCEG